MSDEIPPVILGASGAIKTMADGVLRIQIDIEPRHARDAFMLFGTPGTPVALARITPEAATAEARKEFQPASAKGGALCKLAAIFCGDPAFHDFLAHTMKWAKSYTEPVTAEVAANIIRETCGVASRAELDHDLTAAELFHQNFRIPFQKWNQGARP